MSVTENKNRYVPTMVYTLRAVGMSFYAYDWADGSSNLPQMLATIGEVARACNALKPYDRLMIEVEVRSIRRP